MDENDKILKEYISSKSDYSVPFSFPEKVVSGIAAEKNRRARIYENIQIVSVFIVGAALLILSLNYLNVNYFKINLSELNLSNESDLIKNSFLKLKAHFMDKGTLIWYIIAFNTALLVILQQLLQNKFIGKRN